MSEGVFREALEFLEQKRALSKEEYLKLEDMARAKAFTVGGYTSAEILEEFLRELKLAVEEGTTLTTFRERMNQFLERNGYDGINPWKAENIFRTNLQTAYNAGHYRRMTSPNLLRNRPYWKYVTAGDNKVRESHAEMDGRVYRADDPIWNTWYPPNGFKCRCTVVSMTADQVERAGLRVYDRPPFEISREGKVKVIFPDKGFSVNPARVIWKPDLRQLSPEVKSAYKRVTKKITSDSLRNQK